MAKLQQPSRQKCPDPVKDNWCWTVCVMLAGIPVSLASLRGLPTDKIVRWCFKPRQQFVAFNSDLNVEPHFVQLQTALFNKEGGVTAVRLSDKSTATPSE